MAQSEYSAAVLASSPLFYYKCLESSGGLVDSSGNGLDWSTVNGTPLYNRGGPFGGSDSVGSGSSTSGFSRAIPSTATNNITIESWVKCDAVGLDCINMGQPTAHGWAMVLGNSGVIITQVGGIILSGPKIIEAGWHWFAGVIRSGTWEYYWDGDLWAIAGAASIGSFTGNMVLGGDPGGNGLISNMAFYTTALSAATLRAHYRAGLDVVDKPIVVRTPVLVPN